jgi:hypothetical protein
MVIGLFGLLAGIVAQTLIVYAPKAQLSKLDMERLKFMKWRMAVKADKEKAE